LTAAAASGASAARAGLAVVGYCSNGRCQALLQTAIVGQLLASSVSDIDSVHLADLAAPEIPETAITA